MGDFSQLMLEWISTFSGLEKGLEQAISRYLVGFAWSFYDLVGTQEEFRVSEEKYKMILHCWWFDGHLLVEMKAF